MMTSSIVSHKMVKAFAAASVALTLVGTTACSSLIYDDQSDCSITYRLPFRFIKNILDVDAFSSQVTEVNLSVYDKEGNLVLHKNAERTPTTENDFFLELELEPGVYDMLAWCEGESVISDANSFTLSGHTSGGRIEESAAHLPIFMADDAHYHHLDINRLYHGLALGVELPQIYGIVDLPPIYLTKDTNHLTVQLQNIDDSPVDPDMFSFELEGHNSKLDWQNNPGCDNLFTYRPWSLVGTHTPSGEQETKAGSDYISTGVQAEFTTGRIMADKEQKLTVKHNDTGEEIFSIPLVEYLLLVRNNYQAAGTSQDYLDKYDDFTMVFFIDKNYNWVKSRVIINGWRVLPPQNESL